MGKNEGKNYKFNSSNHDVFFSFGKFVHLPLHAFLVSLEDNKGKEPLIERRQITKHGTDS